MWTPATASTVLALALALSPALTIAARDSSLGLKASHLHKNGIAFGKLRFECLLEGVTDGE